MTYRLVAFIFLVLTLVIFTVDVARYAMGQGPIMRALGAWWFAMDPGSLNLLQAVVQRYLSTALWDGPMVAFLNLPALALFGGLSALFFALEFARGARRG